MLENNIDYPKQHHTTHFWLSVKVMYAANSNKDFSLLTRLTQIFIVEECSNIYIYLSLADSNFSVIIIDLFLIINILIHPHKVMVSIVECFFPVNILRVMYIYIYVLF